MINSEKYLLKKTTKLAQKWGSKPTLGLYKFCFLILIPVFEFFFEISLATIYPSCSQFLHNPIYIPKKIKNPVSEVSIAMHPIFEGSVFQGYVTKILYAQEMLIKKKIKWYLCQNISTKWYYVYISRSCISMLLQGGVLLERTKVGWNNRHQVISSEPALDGATGIKLLADKVQ